MNCFGMVVAHTECCWPQKPVCVMCCSTKDTCHLLFLFSLHVRLQDLTIRDLEKQEREKSANSLESFIFETQVRAGYKGMRISGKQKCFAQLLADLSAGEMFELEEADLKCPGFVFQSLYLMLLGFPGPRFRDTKQSFPSACLTHWTIAPSL